MERLPRFGDVSSINSSAVNEARCELRVYAGWVYRMEHGEDEGGNEDGGEEGEQENVGRGERGCEEGS